jgi:hypothetical protein
MERGTMGRTDLPVIDEHRRSIGAPAEHVWRGLLDHLDGALGGTVPAAYARAVGCSPATSSGPRPLTVGSTVPGFRVVGAIPPEELALEGRHRFSTYALTFRLDHDDADRTTLRAESRATFPGPHGRLYRAAVIRSGGHAVAMRRLLASIAGKIGP